MFRNKRGQGLSTNAIILIILGVAILVLLILGATMGWSKLAPWLSSDNVDEIVAKCQSECSKNSEYGFCIQKLEIILDGESQGKYSCYEWTIINKEFGVKDCSNLCQDTNIELAATGESEW